MAATASPVPSVSSAKSSSPATTIPAGVEKFRERISRPGLTERKVPACCAERSTDRSAEVRLPAPTACKLVRQAFIASRERAARCPGASGDRGDRNVPAAVAARCHDSRCCGYAVPKKAMSSSKILRASAAPDIYDNIHAVLFASRQAPHQHPAGARDHVVCADEGHAVLRRSLGLSAPVALHRRQMAFAKWQEDESVRNRVLGGFGCWFVGRC